MMRPAIREVPLPTGALLAAYRDAGHYTDCFAATSPGPVPHAAYVQAFYTSWLFRLERLVLGWCSRPSTDAQVIELAAGTRADFAAWRVEARAPDQLLLCDVQGRTRSWLMSVVAHDGGGTLYFGSAVVPAKDAPEGAQALDFPYRQLLGFHRAYSRALLRAAAVSAAARGTTMSVP